LREPGADDAVDHAVDGAADDSQQPLGEVAGDAVERVAQRLYQRRAIAIEKVGDEGDQRELQDALGDDEPGLHQHLARRPREPLQCFSELVPALRELAPGGIELTTDQRYARDPFRRPGYAARKQLARILEKMRHVVAKAQRDQGKRNHEHQQDEQRHHQRGEPAAAARQLLDEAVDRPG
jgi:hypothetical protein